MDPSSILKHSLGKGVLPLTQTNKKNPFLTH